MFDLTPFFRPSPLSERLHKDIEYRLSLPPEQHDADALAADWRAVRGEPVRLKQRRTVRVRRKHTD